MMRMLWGALVGYIFFLVVGVVLFFGILTVFGLERLLDAATLEVSWRWLIISLFLVGWLAGAAGKLAATISNRGEAAIVLGVLVAIQGLAMIPQPLDGPSSLAALEGLGTFQLMSYVQFPEWYSYMLPLFAAAFVAYGGYVFAR